MQMPSYIAPYRDGEGTAAVPLNFRIGAKWDGSARVFLFACEFISDTQTGGLSRSARGLKPYTSENHHGTSSLPALGSGARMLPPPEGK